MNAEDRALSILPLSHMFEMIVELALLHCGASIVYARSLVPDTLLKLLESQHVGVQGATGLWRDRMLPDYYRYSLP